jgi:predicted enzyme related to lactoylglutathione lyase
MCSAGPECAGRGPRPRLLLACRIKKIDFVSIPCADQKRALRFYTEQLGFTVFSDQPFSAEQRWIELKIAGAQTKVVLFTPDEHKNRIGGFQNLTFSCDDVDRTYQELQARGVEFTEPPRQEPWGRMAMFKDREGNIFIISAK